MDPKKTGIVNLHNFPETDWLYFNNKGVLKELLNLIVKLNLSEIKNKFIGLSKLTGLSHHFIAKLYLNSRNKIKIMTFKSLLCFLPLNERERFCSIFEESTMRIGYQNSKGYFTVRDLCAKLPLEKSGIKKNVKIAKEKGLISVSSCESNAYRYVVEA